MPKYNRPCVGVIIIYWYFFTNVNYCKRKTIYKMPLIYASYLQMVILSKTSQTQIAEDLYTSLQLVQLSRPAQWFPRPHD